MAAIRRGDQCIDRMVSVSGVKPLSSLMNRASVSQHGNKRLGHSCNRDKPRQECQLFGVSCYRIGAFLTGR